MQSDRQDELSMGAPQQCGALVYSKTCCPITRRTQPAGIRVRVWKWTAASTQFLPTMHNPIRILFVWLASSIGIVALAQPMPPYDITITGSADGCGPGTVIEIISAPGTLPEINELLPLGNFCDFQVTYQMESPLG